jgi:hypothetical protein
MRARDGRRRVGFATAERGALTLAAGQVWGPEHGSYQELSSMGGSIKEIVGKSCLTEVIEVTNHAHARRLSFGQVTGPRGLLFGCAGGKRSAVGSTESNWSSLGLIQFMVVVPPLLKQHNKT